MVRLKDGTDTMTVAELIAALQQLPLDLPVQSEGCDCDGAVGAAVVGDGAPELVDGEVVAGDRRVYLRRS